jgi:hypothetical protein
MGARVLEIQRRRAVLQRELADLEAELVEALEDEQPAKEKPRYVAHVDAPPDELPIDEVTMARARRLLRRGTRA